jgi:hypothetical protein
MSETKKRPGLIRRGVTQGTIDKVAAKVTAAENAETQEFEMRQVALSRVKLWEEQPREFRLTLDDIYRGEIDDHDGYADVKKNELEGIIGLAMSLCAFGMLNAPLAYALPGRDVQLLGGQRRTMASIFALFHIESTIGPEETSSQKVVINTNPDMEKLDVARILIKVYSRRPDGLKMDEVGMIDNSQRSELPVTDRLRWALKYADKKESMGLEVKWRDMADTLGLNRSQAYQWQKVVSSRTDEWVAKIIARVLNDSEPFQRLSEIAAAEPGDRGAIYRSWFESRPTPDNKKKVSLGVSSNLPALRSLILSNVSGEAKDAFANIDWNNPKLVKKAFSNFLKIWEENHG